MSSDYPSSNPFRRKTPQTTPSIPSETPAIINHVAYQQSQPLADTTNLPKPDILKKAAKKVRVQSPPPPSPSTPSIPDSSSTIGEDVYAKPPTPIPRDDDPFDHITSDTSEDEAINKPPQAPLNPFSKTLETMEHPKREASAAPATNLTSPGRASMDVEAFKRLLMTGNAGLGINTPPVASQAHSHHGLGDGGSSTDTSSLSRQSIFEPIQEAHPESPRTSHEISEPEDDRRGLSEISSASGRKKPPPPSSRHGKLIKVELRDDPPSSSSTNPGLSSPQPPTPSSSTSQQFFSPPLDRSNTDLNKPLPPAPNRASHDSDPESVFDKEAAGKTPEPPSPSASIRRKSSPSTSVRKKQAPAPPLKRRHSHRIPEPKSTRTDTSRLSPKSEEESITTPTEVDPGRPRSNSGKAPPPPPTRRPQSMIRGGSHQNPIASPSSISLPPPTPPTRGSSRSISGGNRPPSISSMDMSNSRDKENKRPGIAAPPPPPPPRQGRGSMESDRRVSGDMGRRSGESMRKGSTGSEVRRMESTEAAGGKDILADLTRLQREIDELRGLSGDARRSVT